MKPNADGDVASILVAELTVPVVKVKVTEFVPSLIVNVSPLRSDPSALIVSCASAFSASSVVWSKTSISKFSVNNIVLISSA